MRPILIAAVFGLLAVPAAAQSTTDSSTLNQSATAAATAPAEATTAAADAAPAAIPAPRAKFSPARSSEGGYSGCSYSTAGPVS